MLKLLFVTLLVGASANVVRREVNCEKLLLPFLDDPNPLCAQIYETREAVKNGIASVENTINDSSEETVEDFVGIVESVVRYLKERLPLYLPQRISREVAHDAPQVDFGEFRELVATAAEAAVAADMTASKNILDSILKAVHVFTQGGGSVSEGAMKILKNIVQKRSADSEDYLKGAFATVDGELKGQLKQALDAILEQLRPIQRYMLEELKTLLAGKVQVPYDQNVALIEKLAQEAKDRTLQLYDAAAKPPLEDAVRKIHDLLQKAKAIVAEKPEAKSAISQVVASLSAETASQRSTFADVREAFIKAGQTLEAHYNDIAALVGAQ